MRKLTPVEFRPWALPLIALAISGIVIGAFAAGGPPAGMAAGALVAAAIIVLAARARFEEEIEVAPRSGGSRGVLVVATRAVEGPAAVGAITEAVGRERDDEDKAPVLVIAPALNRALSHWTSDLRAARLQAQERLAISLAVLATAGIDARGSVGDTDPVQATEDALRSFAAREVVFVTEESDEGLVAEVRRRLDRPLRHVGAGSGPDTAPHGIQAGR